jgi:hypothetical protein
LFDETTTLSKRVRVTFSSNLYFFFFFFLISSILKKKKTKQQRKQLEKKKNQQKRLQQQRQQEEAEKTEEGDKEKTEEGSSVPERADEVGTTTDEGRENEPLEDPRRPLSDEIMKETKDHILKCLWEFTSAELLDGPNGFACLHCTKKARLSLGDTMEDLSLPEKEEEEEEKEEEKEGEEEGEEEEGEEGEGTEDGEEDGEEEKQEEKESAEKDGEKVEEKKSKEEQEKEETESTETEEKKEKNGEPEEPKKKAEEEQQQQQQQSKNKSNKGKIKTESGKGTNKGKEKREDENEKLIKRRATKQYLIDQLPPVLILHLKRFMQTNYGSVHKIDDRVIFPLELDLSPFVLSKVGDSPGDDAAEKGSPRFRLVGLVEHIGGLGGGHYVCYIRKVLNEAGDDATLDPAAPSRGQATRWFYFSDSNFHEIPEAKVLQTEAYLLFYERI